MSKAKVKVTKGVLFITLSMAAWGILLGWWFPLVIALVVGLSVCIRVYIDRDLREEMERYLAQKAKLKKSFAQVLLPITLVLGWFIWLVAAVLHDESDG